MDASPAIEQTYTIPDAVGNFIINRRVRGCSTSTIRDCRAVLLRFER